MSAAGRRSFQAVTAAEVAAETGFTPTAGPGLLGKVLFQLGFVPSSELGDVSAEVASLQSQIAAAQSQVGSLQSQLAALTAQQSGLQSQYQSLQGQVASLTTTLSSLQSRLASLQAQYAGLQGTEGTLETEVANLQATVSSLQSQLSSLQSQWSGLQTTLAQDASTITGLTGQVASLKSQVSAYNTITASPLLTSGPNQTDEDFQGGPNDPGYGPYDPAFSGFAPYTASFAIGAVALVTGASGHAVPSLSGRVRLQTGSGYRPGRYLASTVGYVSLADLTTANDAVPGLQAQLASLQTQAGSLGSSVAAAQQAVAALQSEISQATAQVASLNGQISGAMSAVSTVQAEIATVQTDISNLTSQVGALNSTVSSIQSQIGTLNTDITNGDATHQNNLKVISSLQSQVAQWQGYLSDIESGNYPVSVEWTFGDGSGLGSGKTTSHDYGLGSFTPSITVVVTRPDGVGYERTFALPKILVGQWPTDTSIGGDNDVIVVDRQNHPVPNCRVLAVFTDCLGLGRSQQVYTTNPSGSTGNMYGGGSGYINARVLRNPKLTETLNFC